ncbi:MAG TPA: MCE family protein [Cryptosporangiaceae bacterium]|nr:MCE family protein [Cryptosporangiaceae bacterium]
MNRLSQLAPRVIAVLIATVVIVAGSWIVVGQGSVRTLTAHFTSAVGIYPGSDVRILGVKVGEIVDVVPEGSTVRVRMNYETKYKVPADGVAVIVPPSVVSDRYVQLAPVYTGGPVMPDGADLPVSRTATPVELDRIYASLDELATALGPKGANADGSLTKLLSVGRQNLEGQGEEVNKTLRDLSTATKTLSEGRDDLFGTVRNLQRFTTALATSDAAVRQFNSRLANVGAQLARDKDELAAAIRTLSVALAQVAAFVRENRALLTRNVKALAEVTSILVRQKEALTSFLDVAPTALSNLDLAYNPRTGALDNRNNMMAPEDLAVFICTATARLPLEQMPKECFTLVRAMKQHGLKIPEPLQRLLDGTPLRTAPGAYDDEGRQPPQDPPAPGETGPLDRTLGGILPGGR